MINLDVSLDFGREICAVPEVSARKEWLVTNGIGGFASGTVSGLLTRRYHGLLVAALNPPLGRTLLATALDETAQYAGRSTPLAAYRWASGATAPTGFDHLDRFHLDGTTPTWTYAVDDALLEKRVWMQHGANTTYVRYDLVRARRPLHLSVKALVNYRDYHGATHAGDWRMQIVPWRPGLRVTAYDGATPFYLLSDRGTTEPAHDWYRGVFLSVEDYRGLDAAEDHLHAGTFSVALDPGDTFTLVLTTDSDASRDGRAALDQQRAREAQLLADAGLVDAPPAVRQLVLAADQFVVRRSTPEAPDGYSVIAGYPWFSDWGRDTMIALPGLTLGTGRPGVAARILRTFAQFVDEGMLPNRFPDAGEVPEYNTVDATLWYVEAVRAYVAHTDDDVVLRDLYPVLESIVDWHERGTRYDIHMDPADGLLAAGVPGVQLTWMDAKVGDWVVTPRIGKPVEINALWYNALRAMAGFAQRLGRDAAAYECRADRVRESFQRFWNAEQDFCYDVLDGPDGNDAALRPNQILAVSLPHSPLTPGQQQSVVDVCLDRLLTPHGLRSLSPDHAAYVGRYGGDQHRRDGAYHQGTVWAWLIGPFVEAYLRVYDDAETARSFLTPLFRHLADHGLGSVSEIFDGDAPFTPRGCPAQAWSVAELLRAWHLTTRPQRSTSTDRAAAIAS